MEEQGLMDPLVGQSPPGRLTGVLLLAATSAVVGSSLQFGYNTGVINNPKDVIRGWFLERGKEFSSFEWSVVVSLFCAGGMVGGLAAGHLANKLGRRNALLVNNVFLVAGAAFMTFASVWGLLAAGRFIVGIGCGIATLVVPMYISEISPVAYRGALGTLNQLAITLGILIAQLLGMDQALGTEHGWRILLGLTAAASVYQLILFPFSPESPRYLYAHGRPEQAVDALRRLRRSFNVESEIAEMEIELAANIRVNSGPGAKGWRVMMDAHMRRPIIIACGLMLCQQLSGINATFYYSATYFKEANVSNQDLATSLVGAVNVLVTVLVVYLIERLGRRTLLLIGLSGMAVTYAVLTISLAFKKESGMSYVTIAAVMLNVISFAVGPGAIPWLMAAEIIPMEARGPAMSLAVGTNWLANLAVGLTFPIMSDHLNDYTFIPYVVTTSLGFFFVLRTVPETKGLTQEQIDAIFSDRKGERSPLIGSSAL